MISLVHKTLFVHIPKCAGQSVEETFLRDLGLTWENHRHLFGCFERPPSWRKDLPGRLAHLTAHEYVAKGFIPRSLFDACYGFAVVRDPVARVVSMWKYRRLEMPLGAFVEQQVAPGAARGHYWFRSQRDYIFAPGADTLLVDDVLAFSRLAEAWRQVQDRTGLEMALSHRNVSPRQEGRNEEPSRATIETIREIYREDYETFAEF